MSPDTVTLLSSPTCSRCKVAVQHLNAKGIDYEYVDVTQNEQWAAEMRSRNVMNLPQTVRGDEWVEGLDFDAMNRLF